MSYQLIKNKFGTSNKEVISDINIQENIHDFCYIADFGYIFVLRDNHCLAHLNKEGSFVFPWIGDINKDGKRDGKGKHVRLSYPSSIAYCKGLNKCFLVERGGCGLRDINLNNNYVSSPIGTSSVKKMEALISKFDPSEIKTTACVNSMAQVYWTIDVINKGFFFNQGDVRFWIGSGKQGYSVCSRVKYFSFNRPEGLAISKNRIYLADTGNHCIREIMKDKIRLVAGDPEGKGFIKKPSCLQIRSDRLYFIDGDEVKYYSVSNGSGGVLYSSKNIISIAVDEHENLLILEKNNA